VPTLDLVVARNVRAERARRGWRQLDLAEAMGWSVGMVSDLERGSRRCGIEDVPVICRALGVPLLKLLDGAEQDDLATMGLRQ
jgi:transcriptional regulator with XRE-family HTH domain